MLFHFMKLLKKTPSESSKLTNALKKLFGRSDSPTKEPFDASKIPSAVSFNRDFFFWNMRNIPISEAVKSMMICGAPGAGKTISIQCFLQSIAERLLIEGPEACRLIMFDGKCDAVPMLASMGLTPESERVWILNPFDKRSAICSLADAAREPAYIRYMGKAMIPDDKNASAPFWNLAAQQLAQAGVISLNAIKQGDWTLRDLLCALSSRENILGVSARDDRASETAKQILNDDKHSDGVIASLWTKLARFEETAALWETVIQKKVFSVEKFLSGGGVLILGNDPVLNESIQPINQLILKMVTDAVLRGPETRQVKHFFVFDEFPALGKVDFIGRLLSEGRSKGASVLIGTQSVESLVNLYGEALTDVILGQCAHKMFLRAGSARTAEWAEKHFGKIRHMETTYSETYQHGEVSRGFQHGLKERSLFLASVFLDIPFPVQGGIYHSINDVPSLESTFVTRRPFDEVLSWLKPRTDVPAIERRTDPKDQVVRPWSEEEKKSFLGVEKEKGAQPYLPPRRQKRGDDPNQGTLF